MTSSIRCDVVSAEKKLFSGDAEMIVVSGESGDLGILPGHTPLLSGIRPGPVRVIKQGGEQEVIYVSGGYLEVQPNKVIVLADTGLRADDIDEARAVEAKEKAEKAIENSQGEMDYSTAASKLARASAMLRTIDELRNKVHN